MKTPIKNKLYSQNDEEEKMNAQKTQNTNYNSDSQKYTFNSQNNNSFTKTKIFNIPKTS